jgi:hypothetical protein
MKHTEQAKHHGKPRNTTEQMGATEHDGTGGTGGTPRKTAETGRVPHVRPSVHGPKKMGEALPPRLSQPRMTGAPYLARFSRDVGYHRAPPNTLHIT